MNNAVERNHITHKSVINNGSSVHQKLNSKPEKAASAGGEARPSWRQFARHVAFPAQDPAHA